MSEGRAEIRDQRRQLSQGVARKSPASTTACMRALGESPMLDLTSLRIETDGRFAAVQAQPPVGSRTYEHGVKQRLTTQYESGLSQELARGHWRPATDINTTTQQPQP